MTTIKLTILQFIELFSEKNWWRKNEKIINLIIQLITTLFLILAMEDRYNLIVFSNIIEILKYFIVF